MNVVTNSDPRPTNSDARLTNSDARLTNSDARLTTLSSIGFDQQYIRRLIVLINTPCVGGLYA